VASESDVIGWTAGVDALLLVEMAEDCEIRESTLGRADLGSSTDGGGLPSGWSLLKEPLVELDMEVARTGGLSWEGPGDLDLACLSRSRRKNPVKRPSLRDSGIECASSLLDSGEEVGESFGGSSRAGTERKSLRADSAVGVSRPWKGDEEDT
jgi:hypothetical protein